MVSNGHGDSTAGIAVRPNKRMQLTKLRAAPVWQAEVPPCAPAGEADGGTASQLIRSVRWTSASASGSKQANRTTTHRASGPRQAA
jgi:hypothetical protein